MKTQTREAFQRLKKAIGASPGSDAEAFGKVVRALLPRLERFVWRELAALRARGDLNPRYPPPEEVVDEVLARGYLQLAGHPQDRDPLHRLYQLAHQVLNEEVHACRREARRFVSTESAAPRPHDDTLDERDQDVFEFWQPDEMLKLEDVLPVAGDTPEQLAGDAELRRYLHTILARMPNNWRRAVWLAQAEGIPVPDVAQLMDAAEDEVRQWIRQGDEYLRAQLAEAGYRPADEGKLPAYFVPTPATATPELAQALDAVMKGAA